jgi:hypothetical protein
MGSADDRAPRADTPDAATPADIGIAGPSPTAFQSGSVNLKRARLIRAWARTTASGLTRRCCADTTRAMRVPTLRASVRRPKLRPPQPWHAWDWSIDQSGATNDSGTLRCTDEAVAIGSGLALECGFQIIDNDL